MTRNKETIQSLFLKLVKIDSCSGQEKKLADFVINRLKKLNLIAKKDKFGNILAKNKNFNKNNSILICTHLDTIKSNKGVIPKIKKGVIYSDKKNILGADNKAAIAEIIYALENSKNKLNSNFELLFTVQEENGLVGVKKLNKKLIKSKRALVLDYNFPVGYIVLSAPSAVILKIKILGRASHSARAKLGINAIQLACECINEFKFKDQKGLTSNIGLIKGGTSVNVVPDFVELNLAIRAISEIKLAYFIKRIKKHFKQNIPKRKGRVSIEKTRVGFAYSYKKQDRFIQELIKNFKQLNIRVKLEKSFGLSDANILNHLGIKAVEIGYGPKNVHTNKESIAINQMLKMSNLLTKLSTIK